MCQSDLIAQSLVYEGKDGVITAALYPNEEAVKQILGTLADEHGEAYRKAIGPLLHKEVERVNALFPAYKSIGRIVLREDDFVRTTTQKIKRNEPENFREEYVI